MSFEPGWVFAFASTIGNSHISEGIPCQDACRVGHYDGCSIAVVSDGAGSSENSDKGAKQATESCLYHFSRLIEEKGWASSELPDQAIWHAEAKLALQACREDMEKFAMSNELDVKTLACTVIVAIVLPHGLLVTHIGDGRAGYCNQQGEWFSMIAPFHGELANETVFVTSNIWDEDVIDTYIESSVVNEEVKALCLLSDGCEKASFECNLYDAEKEVYFDPNKPFPLFFNPNVEILPRLYRNGKTQEEINLLWEQFLAGGNEKLKMESDDKTLVLGVRLTLNADTNA